MIAVTAEGREPRTYAVTLNEGQAWNVEVEVGPAKPKTTGDEKPKAVGSRAEANSWRSVGYASIAVGAASAVATGVLAWRYFAAHAELDAECNAQRQCSDSGLRAVGAAGVLRTATIVAASVSVAAIGSGFALLWTHPNSAPPSPAALVPCGIAWTTAL
jgi:hypothetical protein